VRIKSRVETALRVVTTFGLVEIARLLLRKMKSRQGIDLKNLPPSGVSIHPQRDWTDEFFADILNTSANEISLARIKYALYRKSFEERIKSPRKQFFDSIFDLGPGMSEFLYSAIIVKKPNKVIETGVAAGVSTNTMLNALHSNGKGELFSVDITEQVGELVEGNLKSRWLIKILPEIGREKTFARLLRENADATIFLHDSDHSVSWQIKEFTNVVRELTNIELILFDDIGQELIDYIQLNFKHLEILVLDENRKFSGIIRKSDK